VDKEEYSATTATLRRSIANVKSETAYKLQEAMKEMSHELDRKAEEKDVIAIQHRLTRTEGSIKPLNNSVNWIEGSLPLKVGQIYLLLRIKL